MISSESTSHTESNLLSKPTNILTSFTVITCLIADTESQIEGGNPRHRPRHRLHGEGAFVAVQQGDEGWHICNPAPDSPAKITQYNISSVLFYIIKKSHIFHSDIYVFIPQNKFSIIIILFSICAIRVSFIDLWPAEGGDPSAQLHVAVWTQVIAANKQLHRVIPLSAGRVSPAGTWQGRVQLQRVKVQQACRET